MGQFVKLQLGRQGEGGGSRLSRSPKLEKMWFMDVPLFRCCCISYACCTSTILSYIIYRGNENDSFYLLYSGANLFTKDLSASDSAPELKVHLENFNFGPMPQGTS